MAFAMLAGVVTLNSATASAQAADTQTATSSQEQDTAKQDEFVREWYDVCFQKKPKDETKCYNLSKELISKYPKVQEGYIKAANAQITRVEVEIPRQKAYTEFAKALEAYYTPPQDASKLENLFNTGDELSKVNPGLKFLTVGQSAIAGATGVMNETSKNAERAKEYNLEALSIFTTNNPPQDVDLAKSYNTLRLEVLPVSNQYLGYYYSVVNIDPQKALDYLGKSIAIKSPLEGKGWKDPNNYLIRSGVYNKQYTDLSKQYSAMTDEQKTGDEGKKVLSEINDILDKKLIPENARIIATANKPEHKSSKDAALQRFESLWNFRTGAPEKAAEYLKAFTADPTVEGPAIPVKASDSTEGMPAPLTAGPTKLSTSATGAPGTGSKATSTKTTPATKTKTTKGKRRRG